jgi:hypothetical protein
MLNEKEPSVVEEAVSDKTLGRVIKVVAVAGLATAAVCSLPLWLPAFGAVGFASAIGTAAGTFGLGHAMEHGATDLMAAFMNKTGYGKAKKEEKNDL